MLDVMLRIVSVLGIVFLAIVIFILAVLLLALFFPIAYRVRGTKGRAEPARGNAPQRGETSGDAEDLEVSARLSWLFGLLRARFVYPRPGILTVKLLCFKLYQTKLPPKSREDKQPQDQKSSGNEPPQSESGALGAPMSDGSAAARQEGGVRVKETQGEGGVRQEDAQERDAAQPEKDRGEEAPPPEDGKDGFFKKFQKIKYTISGIYDKIKEIWKNISYYAALLQEEDTRQLYAYAKLRLVKILKNIRPRRIRADILFGTGSPDTTGYAFGIYCMLYPALGKKAVVTPDFERAVLEGRLAISGHITLFVLGANLVRLALDKRLRRLLKKLRRGAGSQEKDARNKAA